MEIPRTASVVITTKNRRDELRVALRSAVDQTIQPEVIVMDDGSTDGTLDMVRKEFPKARLHHFEESCGYIVRRNEAARLAKSEVIFSIDDDAEFSTPQTVEQTLVEFVFPRVAAIAIPYCDVNKDRVVRQKAPDRSRVWVTDRYIGTAHAVRREVFLKLGGYRENFVHQGEEGDFCLRMLNAGFVTGLGNAGPIHHFESPRRDFRRMDYFGRRNDLLFAWHNVPAQYLPAHLAATTFRGLLLGLKLRRPRYMTRGVCAGYLGCLRFWAERAPVKSQTYLLHRELKKRGPRPLEQIEARLAPL
jgi:glycosyltransferase involved in cell wall biosynthesis